MTRTPLFWRIYPPFFLLSLAALVAVAGFGFHTLQEFQFRHTETEIQERARLLSASTARCLRDGTAADLQALCRAEGSDGQIRITVIAPDGRVLADSAEPPETMDNHADRPEIRNALTHGSGIARRWSHTIGRDLIYATTTIRDGQNLVAIVRAATPVADFEAHLQTLYKSLLVITLAVLVLVAGGAYVFTRRITHPLGEMQAAAARFAAGDFGAKLRLAHSREMDALAQDLNRMATQLDERFRTIERQRNEEQAILGSMSEGLIAVDRQQHILTMNRAAALVLGVEPQQTVGRSFLEVTRTPSLHDLLTQALQSDAVIEGDATLTTPQEVSLRVHASPLKDAAGQRIGAVLVWADVTRLHRLENLRREFVANVSHELRTPITSIKGFIETLEDGAMQDPAEARRFLGIISLQADRLGAIVEDLLLLSRLDRDANGSGLEKETCGVREIIQGAAQSCARKAGEKRVAVEVSVADGLRLLANPSLLQQAIVNLLDNAINYSETSGRVALFAEAAGGEMRISVRDWGCGIASEHHERIFERFYRVDKARSRDLGGTGLGLAIVKHILQAHGGRVSLQSTPGQGSTFTLHLPAATAPTA